MLSVNPTQNIQENFPGCDNLNIQKAMFDKPISQAQATRLWTIARLELKLQDCEVRAVLAEYGFTSTKFIPAFQYNEIMNRLAQCAKAKF